MLLLTWTGMLSLAWVPFALSWEFHAIRVLPALTHPFLAPGIQGFLDRGAK